MDTCRYLRILLIIILFTFISIIFQYMHQDNNMKQTSLYYHPVNITSDNEPRDAKWIVVTSVQNPTEDVKKLAGQPGWHLVVVADTKTPPDWNYPGVHFLSLERQKKLFGKFAEQLPYKSYTRKNLGYLYALMNGAKWIYDTDDDNKPYGLGLAQFDYSFLISGLRYISKSSNISEKLFNPYRFYGFDNMWPRGFPLEYLEGHTNGKDRMVSCRQMNPPAVQQGIVRADPDVDAVYRLLYSNKASGLNVTFNSIAPPIVLDTGTYAPWNSQNTLFHYKAFFIMYLPTTVAFRVTDIWRSYFGQKLLHLIGENVGFYPMNAVQFRNAHNYLNDFHQEIVVYEQSGKLVEFLDSWSCSHGNIVNCTLELTDAFVANKFFGKPDRDLIEDWLKQLAYFGYNFPPLSKGASPILLGKKYSNCRTANLNLGIDNYRIEGDDDNVWAAGTVNGFGEVLEWCKEATGGEDDFLPASEKFLRRVKRLKGLQQKKDTVLVFISSQNWRSSIIGLLQRMYSPFFKTTIFCGTWTDPTADPGLLPPIEPLNFVNITPEEMRDGAGFGYCVPKVKNLRLQNVAGYYFVADDTVFNIWHDLPLEKYLNPIEIDYGKFWWVPEEIQRSFDAFEKYYKNDLRFGKSWQKYKNKLQQAFPGKNVTDHYLNESRKAIADFFYVPTHTMEYIGNFLEIMTEAEVFVEVAFGKLMDGLDYIRGGPFTYLWKSARHDQWSPYNSSIVGLHPMKLGRVHYDLGYREKFCNTVVRAFGEEIYGRLKSSSNTSMHYSVWVNLCIFYIIKVFLF